MTFLVTGSRPVAGKNPGATVHETDLAGANIDALVSAGHLTPTPKTPKADKAEAPKE
jgi:hypothetical protein